MNKKGTRVLASATAIGIVLTMLPLGNVKAAPGDVNKMPGKDRYETAANVATANWKEGAENVIITSGEGYADSLSASVLAKKLNAPIILTKSKELHKGAKEALKTLKAKNLHVIGGNASVSQSIRDDLKREGYALTELGGKTRFETNLAISKYLVEKHNVKADEILVVNGKDGFSDALSAAPVAAAKGQILLIVGKDTSTADLAAKFIEEHNSKVTVIGTEKIIPKTVYDKLGAKERVIGGANRFETNLNIMKHFKLNTDKLYVANATGDGYADALVASALAGRTASQLILTHTKDSQETKNAIDYIKSIKNDKTEVGLVGGNSVIPEEVVDKIKEIVKEESTKNPGKPSRPSKPSKPTEPEKNKFEIIWSFADVDEDLDVNTTNGKDDAKHDYVYIKFNKPISVSGDSKSVLNTSNYKLNKMHLPKGTEIKPNIKGLDDADKVTDSITIVLPNEYLNGKNEPHIITISSYLESSTTGDVLTNGGDKILTWSSDGREIFNASFSAEKQIYLAEVSAKKDLTLKDNLINAEKALETAKAAIKSLNNKTSGKSALEERVNDVEKTVKNARIKFDEKTDFEFSNGKITKYIGNEIDIVIPETIRGEKVTAIEDSAFKNKNLTSVKIPKTVESIGMQAFAKNNLTSIELPESLKYMGNIAFMDNKLASVKIPKNLINIPTGAFSKNEISSVVISEGVIEIALSAFAENKLESVVIPSTVEFIRNKAFSGNQLKVVNIPSNVKDIGKDAFANNKNIKLVYYKLIEAIKRAESIKTEGKEADKVKVLKKAIEEGNKLNDKPNATLEEVNKVVESINNAIEALNKESSKTTIKQIKPLGIKNIDVDLGTTEANVKAKLPQKVTIVDSKDKEHNVDINWSILKYDRNIAADYTAIGTFKLPEGVFQSSPEADLKVVLKVTITPKGVENREWQLKDFTFKGTAITGFSESGKEKFKKSKDLSLPNTNESGEKINEIADKAFCSEFEIKGDSNESFKDKDKAKQDPKIGINSVIIPDTVKIIGKEAFRNNCLTDINIPKSVTTIKDLAFNNNKLKTLSMPDSVTELGNGAFTLNDIEDLKFSKELKTIPAAFGYNNLVSVTIPEGVTRIEDMAFSDNKLAQVTLPTTLEYLSGFNNNNLKSINIPTSVTELGKKAFARNKISSVKIPGNVKKIGVSAFQNTWHDTFLTSITIEDGVEKIDEYAFSLNHLKDVNIPKSVKELSPNAFHKNLGYDGVVHLFTDNYNNPNNLKESKYQVIDPAKLTIKYISEDKTLKEEEIWKIGKKEGEEKYLHIGDKAVEIAPEYEDNEYELENTDVRKVDLNYKENELIVKCKKKESVDKLTIKSIGEVAPVVVDFGTEQNVVMDKLSKNTYIVDSNGENHEVELNWTIKNYNGNVPGEYTAVAIFKLPQGISQSEPETILEVQGRIIVKEDFENIQDSKWEIEDFNFEGTILAGFSDKGEERLKANKDLILPKANDKGEAITKVKNYAFAKNGLTSLAIPKGLSGLVIGTNAFEENQINTLYIPEGVKEIDAYAFSKNKLKYVDFPGTLKKIGNHALADNQLVSVIFSEETNMIAIDRFSFANNKITSIILLNDVTKVNGEAFTGNQSCNSDGKVHIFTKSFDPNNCNQWFPDSQYHKIIPLNK
ncbi:cell wall-binding repeat-containing protein [Clostridium botulinum]|uniref:cell wall-binding repeat-containing protein n=1 Tax=Clostridium botulinum TaxID=1491 RepID=UPI0006A6E237|nr:cell wall-binding repeat-containing protein [Clostridium botulinum]AWB16294.1 cell wall-binding repeat-containing protein [Clostridium botulinum]AWB29110.1 cell wall-binding repeat-containing protein [Clostridium botulinum]EGT5616874.1 cell wall-binding repeat-containing protein [Clostridium botulinum]EGT5621454.1 cell wall-binding repeat-containing protein [Clostridium botulinum]EGT5624219.1 cell wall-binding repeat-containing protein [Clostridium botulinum]